MQQMGLENNARVYNFLYDFSVHGGAVGAITVGPKSIPASTVIYGGMIHVVTAVTSDGAATVALHVTSAADILAATAKATLSLDAILNAVPAFANTNAFMTTAASQLTVTVAVAALTAGKIHVALFGFPSIT